MLWIVVALATANVPAASGLTPLQSFYPPQLNDTSYISNATIGTYGGVYQSPTRGPNTTAPYGSYDYCAMPHPRVQEYRMPEPIQNGSIKANLVYLEYLQRHQRRTPYNILPGGENAPYYCDDIHPFLYASPQNGPAPLPVYARTYTDATNPFVLNYVNGTCQYPQMTIGGILDAYQHGQDLWRVYGAKLGLIPCEPDDRVNFRSSESALTQDSAGGVLRGLWPDYEGALPLHQQANAVDTVNGGFSCPAQGSLLSAIKSTAEWQKHLNVTASLRANLGSLLGANTTAWQSTFDHFGDNFQGRLCNGYQLPCNVKNTSNCVTTAQADEVFRAGDWEWNYYWRTNPNATLYIQLVEGLFIGEILSRFEAVASGTSKLSYEHVFVHDGDIGPILGALGINELRWPGMASNIAFEIWQTECKDLYARVLYSGQPLQTIHGILDWLPLSRLTSIMQVYVPKDILRMCNS